MNKSILMSIQPKWVCEILNGNKKIEVRKRFPKDYVGWVYIYCTLGNNKDTLIDNRDTDGKFQLCWAFKKDQNELIKFVVNGKVVARFWCDKVDEYVNGACLTMPQDSLVSIDFSNYETFKVLEKSCLTEDELFEYCNDLSFKAIRIGKLEIFDKPKELRDFKPYQTQLDIKRLKNWGLTDNDIKSCKLVKAPQSYMFIGEL